MDANINIDKCKTRLKSRLLPLLSFLLINLLLATSVSAQATDAAPNITPVQAGTVTLNKGRATVLLDNNIADKLAQPGTSYYVVLTAIDNYLPVSIIEKTNRSFVVGVNTTTANITTESIKFDFVVFLSQPASTDNKYGQISSTKDPKKIGRFAPRPSGPNEVHPNE